MPKIKFVNDFFVISCEHGHCQWLSIHTLDHINRHSQYMVLIFCKAHGVVIKFDCVNMIWVDFMLDGILGLCQVLFSFCDG